MPWKSLFSLLLLVSSAISSWAQANVSSKAEGGITGTVLTEDNQLAVGAMACISQTFGNSTAISCRFSTDKDGRFTIEHLKPGKYQVFAINDAEGYSIDNQRPGQQDVAITAEQPWANITVQMRSRGGILAGTITDKLSGKSITLAQMMVTAIDKNGDGSTASVNGTNFNVPIPADCDVLVLVMAKGYKGWFYTDTGASRPVLKLASGERKVLNIQLEPLTPDSAPR